MLKYLLLFLVFSSFSFAQGRETYFTPQSGIGVMGSYYKSADADNSGFMGAIVGRTMFTRQLGAELSVGYRSEDYLGGFVTISSVPVLLSAMLYPTDYIYGLAGIGLYSTTIKYGNISFLGISLGDVKYAKIGYHLGAGATYPLTSNFRIFGDFRYHFLSYNVKTPVSIINEITIDANYYSVNAGILLMF